MDQQVRQLNFSSRNSSNRLWHWMSCLWVIASYRPWLFSKFAIRISASTHACLHGKLSLADSLYRSHHFTVINKWQIKATTDFWISYQPLWALYYCLTSMPLLYKLIDNINEGNRHHPHYEQPCSHCDFYSKHLSKEGP